MQAVVLAGGMRSRLWPITRDIPKPLVPVAGVPFLEHQIRFLARQCIADVVVLTGHLGEQIEKYFDDGHQWGLSIRYSQEAVPMGTGGALREARPLLAEKFLVIYGDSYLPIDYWGVLQALKESTATGVVVVYDNRLGETMVNNNIAVGEDNRVTRYDKQASGDPGLTYVEAGVLAFRHSVLDLIPASGAASLENDVYPKLIASQQLIA
jgi:NDP-sugar pyrophosphorylase family protein